MHDVHIVGGGPVGLTAAVSCARNGYDVLLSEEHKTVGRHFVCSTLCSTDGLDSIKDIVDYKDVVINRIDGANFYLLDGKRLFSVKRKGVACVLDRRKFEERLLSKAEEEGVRINLGRRVVSGHKGKVVIGADGPLSSTATFFGFPGIKKFFFTAQTTVKKEFENPHTVSVFFSEELFPGMFGWVIQKEGYTEIGGGALLPKKPNINGLLKKFSINPKHVRYGIIPASLREKTANKRAMLVGDAAGQTKSTTGGGIVFGCNCAKLSAQCIHDPIIYEREWRRRYRKELFLHSLISKFLSSLSNHSLEGLFFLLRKIGFERTLSRYGDMDMPSRLFSNMFADTFY